MNAASTSQEIRIGISSCLLGENVRFDGGHKHDRFLTRTVGQFVRFVPLCPEMEIGLGAPRPSMRLVRGEEGIRLVAPSSGRDLTEQMCSYSERKAEEIASMNLCGFILKRGSPSCGMERVKIYEQEMPENTGRGLFAEALMWRMPLLPVEEEGRLCDPGLRENFFERVFAYHRLRSSFGESWKLGELVQAHTREKLLLLAHHPESYRSLGKLVAHANEVERDELELRYKEGFLSALSHQATKGRHANVLQHMAGYVRKYIGPEEKQEIVQVVEDYRLGLVPLLVPLTLLRHHVGLHKIEYLSGQTYLHPHPKELMLRNHV